MDGFSFQGGQLSQIDLFTNLADHEHVLTADDGADPGQDPHGEAHQGAIPGRRSGL